MKNLVVCIKELSFCKYKESILTMFASENMLKNEWDNRLDERWNDIQ